MGRLTHVAFVTASSFVPVSSVLPKRGHQLSARVSHYERIAVKPSGRRRRLTRSYARLPNGHVEWNRRHQSHGVGDGQNTYWLPRLEF
ncbi:hypothetical protein IWZ00DRAFT_276735 [Phyllosticta capitalensis]|uniref:Secreted protein n=1 Tax=Phyllosticta capitalensis TaxID=121624 RepID=A0ABR1YPS2_9PEZI